MSEAGNSAKCCEILSRLLFHGAAASAAGNSGNESIWSAVAGFGEREWDEIASLASSNHVIVRAFPKLRNLLAQNGSDQRAGWLDSVVAKEQSRIFGALSRLAPICRALGDAGRVIVIKSLDHWPDLGSDLDLYTNAKSDDVLAILREQFHASVEERSWGDRLANKWNFAIPGLAELIEVHVRRLGQMGEQSLLGESLIARAIPATFAAHTFTVPSPEHRVAISTLQRMFRHFYIRLCDMADFSKLIERNALDYDYLRSLGELTGLWDGMATYLNIVRGYVNRYREPGISVPSSVTAVAHFGSEQVRFNRQFLRIPIVPHSAKLYAAELRTLLYGGAIDSTVRLSLLPALATAALLKQKVAGTDRGIW